MLIAGWLDQILINCIVFTHIDIVIYPVALMVTFHNHDSWTLMDNSYKPIDFTSNNKISWNEIELFDRSLAAFMPSTYPLNLKIIIVHYRKISSY